MSSSKDFLLIGVGLPRTGTNSTQTALQKLLPGKCYHMFETVKEDKLEHYNFWDKMFNETATDEEIREFFLSRGYVACVDAPTTFVYRQLIKVFPNAKILLSTRDPKSWINSMKETLCTIHARLDIFLPIIYYLGFIGRMIQPKMVPFIMSKHEEFHTMLEACRAGSGVQFYNDWNEKIMKEIPSEKLCVFSVKEGWKPLCDFLDVPVPNEEFPRVNDRNSFKEKSARLQRNVMMKLALFGVPVIASILYGLYLRYY